VPACTPPHCSPGQRCSLVHASPPPPPSPREPRLLRVSHAPPVPLPPVPPPSRPPLPLSPLALPSRHAGSPDPWALRLDLVGRNNTLRSQHGTQRCSLNQEGLATCTTPAPLGQGRQQSSIFGARHTDVVTHLQRDQSSSAPLGTCTTASLPSVPPPPSLSLKSVPLPVAPPCRPSPILSSSPLPYLHPLVLPVRFALTPSPLIETSTSRAPATEAKTGRVQVLGAPLTRSGAATQGVETRRRQEVVAGRETGLGPGLGL